MLEVGGDPCLVVAMIGAHQQVLGDGQATEHTAAFRHEGKPQPDQRVGGQPVEARVAIVDFPLAGDHACKRLQGRGLARAIRADQTDHLPFLDGEGDALHRSDAAVMDGEIGHGQKRAHAAPPR
jgi:hypothetical protein